MQTETVTTEQVIELAATMPREQLAQWYAYGLAIRSTTLPAPAAEAVTNDEAALRQEFAAWEAASDEDWLKLENGFTEVV